MPAADMATVPVLVNTSGFTQHTLPCATAPGATVSTPLLVIAGPASWIDSKPGQGSCFRVYLPLREKRGTA